MSLLELIFLGFSENNISSVKRFLHFFWTCCPDAALIVNLIRRLTLFILSYPFSVIFTVSPLLLPSQMMHDCTSAYKRQSALLRWTFNDLLALKDATQQLNNVYNCFLIVPVHHLWFLPEQLTKSSPHD